jgi:hypothetical protein
MMVIKTQAKVMITQPGLASRRARRPCGPGRSGVLRWLVRSTVLRSAVISVFMFITGPLDEAWERRLPITTLGI